MTAEVAIREAIHEAVGERIQLLRGARLRNAGSPVAQRRKGCNGNHCGSGERGICGRREVHMELVQVQIVSSEIDHVVGRSAGRSSQSVQIRRQRSTYCRTLLKADLGCALPGQLLCAIVGACIRSHECVSVKHVECFVVAIGPYAHLRVIVEIVVLERIPVEGSGCVGSRGNSDALQVGRRGYRELAEHPALREFVVEHNGIAIIICLAAAPEARPQGVACGRSCDQSSSRFVEDCEGSVHPLHVLRRSYRAIRIRRRSSHREPVLPLAQALKALTD